MSESFLDKVGLTELWSKITNKFVSKSTLDERLAKQNIITLTQGVKYRKVTDNFCEIFVDGIFNITTANKYITVGTLPEGFRPAQPVYGRNALADRWFAISVVGEVLVTSSVTGSQGFYFHELYGV